MEKIIEFYKTHKRQVTLGVLGILALSIPIIVSQVLKQQDIRQRASTGSPVILSLSPSSKTVNKGEDFEITLTMNTNGNDISAIDGVLEYNSTKFELIGTKAHESYTLIDGANSQQSTTRLQRIILINQTATPISGENVNVVIFKFKALDTGSMAIAFSHQVAVKIAASGISGNIPVTGLPGATYVTVVDTNITPTATTDCPATNKREGCPCDTNSQCASSLCGQRPGTGEVSPPKVCLPIISPTPTTNPQCPLHSHGDADCNGQVKLADYNLWVSDFLTDLHNNPRSDFNNSGSVTLADYNIWLSSFLGL